ncbi:hypothetical protein HII36_51750 [Nonomuraea sp. NN258]|uniref:DUF6879 family protein n=1 Tax=Nonomuraea antri TaxID=2730852 RepID=UPI001569994F|nr:DUF6879 family protein [Nonomuraea antri]NRQ40244.1 hypothetical protein [Nonomuraea antri]
MDLLTGADFERLFTTFKVSAFRLETRERYHLAKNEEEPLREFLAGRPVDMEWLRFWLDLSRRHRDEGRSLRRVRVVTHPFSDYTRFGLMTAAHNVRAGDDIRYLERTAAERAELPRSDWWLFDDERVAFLHFREDDVLLGAEIISDPAVVERHRQWQEIAWSRSESREEFVKNRA